jgi:hypothetical protein
MLGLQTQQLVQQVVRVNEYTPAMLVQMTQHDADSHVFPKAPLCNYPLGMNFIPGEVIFILVSTLPILQRNHRMA